MRTAVTAFGRHMAEQGIGRLRIARLAAHRPAALPRHPRRRGRRQAPHVHHPDVRRPATRRRRRRLPRARHGQPLHRRLERLRHHRPLPTRPTPSPSSPSASATTCSAGSPADGPPRRHARRRRRPRAPSGLHTALKPGEQSFSANRRKTSEETMRAPRAPYGRKAARGRRPRRSGRQRPALERPVVGAHLVEPALARQPNSSAARRGSATHSATSPARRPTIS